MSSCSPHHLPECRYFGSLQRGGFDGPADGQLRVPPQAVFGSSCALQRASESNPYKKTCWIQKSDERTNQMSLHFRGPLQLKQLAVYMPTTVQKRTEAVIEDQKDCQNLTASGYDDGDNHHGSYQKQHEHLRKAKDAAAVGQMAQTDVKRRACDPIVWVTATINNQVVSWINDWCPDQQTRVNPTSAPSLVTSTAPPVEAPAATTAPTAPTAQLSQQQPQQPSQAPQPASNGNPGSITGIGSFSRTGYYNARRQESRGLTFLGNFGGIGSGKWTS